MTKVKSILALALLACSVQLLAQEQFSERVEQFIIVRNLEVAIQNVTVIDGTGAPAVHGQTVVFEGDRIVTIDSVGKVAIPEFAEVIDGTGKTLIPGLVMLHEHMFYSTPFKDQFSLGQMSWTFPRLYLAGGATTIRTAGSINPTVDLNVKRMIQKGQMVGPEMDVTGPFINSGDFPILDFPPLIGENGASDLVNFWADQGVTSFKAYTTITRSDLKQAIDAAHARGHKVTGHLCSITYQEAAELGIDCLEHGFYMSSDFHAQKLPDMCDPFEMNRALRSMDVDAQPMKDLMQTLIDSNVAVCSTLPVFEPHRPHSRMPGGGYEALDEHYQQKISADFNRFSGYDPSRAMAYFYKQIAWERQFYEMGGLLVAGTDPTGSGVVIAGYANQHVPELFVEGGFSVEEAINICTLHGARYLDREDEIGSIEVGKRADLVLLDGDLSRNISRIRNMEIVFKGGIGFDSKALFDSVKGLVGTN